MLTTISTHTYGIGYIGLGFLEDNPSLIKGLWIGRGNPAANFVEPTKAHVYDGTYKVDGTANPSGTVVFRWLWYVTYGVPHADKEGALKANFISYARYNRSSIDAAGYLRIYLADFTGATPSFSSEDSAPLHPNLPDDQVNSADTGYYVNNLIAYLATNLINPYCDFNHDNQINSADTAAYVTNLLKYYAGTGLYP
jgi:hypothetical protein